MWRRVNEYDETIVYQCLTCHEQLCIAHDKPLGKFCMYCGNRMGKQFVKRNKRWNRSQFPQRFYFWWQLEELKVDDGKRLSPDGFYVIHSTIKNPPKWQTCRTIFPEEFVKQRKYDEKLLRHKSLLHAIKEHKKQRIPIRLKATYPDKSEKILKQWG